jgi:DNA-binding NarL/FixJ family response regulator
LGGGRQGSFHIYERDSLRPYFVSDLSITAALGADAMRPIRILLADDHVMVREGTRRILERQEGLTVVGEAGDGLETVELAQQTKPDIILMDISMPVMNGIDATRRIKEVCPRAAVLVLTAYDDDQYVFAILEAGAAGYLLKNARSSELIDAVRRVSAGESVLHPSVAKKVLRRLAAPVEQAHEEEVLTPRELEVLQLAGRGLTNREIAQRLVLSPRTVESHMANIFGKLNVGSRTEAVLVGLRRQWIDLERTNGSDVPP